MKVKLFSSPGGSNNCSVSNGVEVPIGANSAATIQQQIASLNPGGYTPTAKAINNARAQILAGLCDVALVVGADTTPKGFFTPVGGDRKDDPDWLRFRLLGATNPVAERLAVLAIGTSA